MNSNLIGLVLEDQKIAYLIADRNLTICEISGWLPPCFAGQAAWVGQSVLELAPEYIGSEQALADILAGALPRFQLPLINRETAGGDLVYLTLVALPYRNEDGEISGLLHLIHDMTETGVLEQRVTQQRNELRLLQQQLQRQNIELAASNTELRRLTELKSTFVSVAAHELRTPLSAIFGYLELLVEINPDPLTEQQLNFLEIIKNSTNRLLNITHDLLDVTRIEAGQIELLLRAENLLALAELVAAELKPQFEAKAQRVAVEAEPDLPLALCDQARAVQIITNLMSNASKYTPASGSIAVSLSMAPEAGFLQLAVKDNGVGIAPPDQEKLFRRFFRAGTASLTGASGTGLGLYITRSLVELHGGRIWFESMLGQGSTFYVTFPIADYSMLV